MNYAPAKSAVPVSICPDDIMDDVKEVTVSEATDANQRPRPQKDIKIQIPKDFNTASLPRFESFDGDFTYQGTRYMAGLYYFGLANNGDALAPKRLCSPIKILARTRDNTSNKWGRVVQWYDPDGKRKQLVIADSQLASNHNTVLEQLSDGGLAISHTVKLLVIKYLQSTEVPGRGVVVDKTGWANEGVYITPDETICIGKTNNYYLVGEMQPEPSQSSGTLDSWKEHVASLCVNNSRLTFAVSMSFAAPLLHLVDAQGGGIHFTGPSSSGKSVTMRASASVVNKPDKAINTWRATDNGLEGIAAKHNDALLFLDELGQVDERKVGDIAYMLGNGVGKKRANKNGTAKDSFKWRLLFMSNGEIDLAKHIEAGGKKVKGGQLVRMLSIPADAGAGLGIFEHLHGLSSGAELADAIATATANHYGTAFKPFIRHIASNIDACKQRIRQIKEQIIKSTCPEGADGQVIRAAERFALVAAGGVIATEAGITGWPANTALEAAQTCFKAWLDHRGGIGSYEEEEVLERVRSTLTHHANQFETLLDGTFQADHSYVHNRLGFVKGTTYYLTPDGFNRMMSGIDPAFARQVLVKAKIIRHGLGKDLPRMKLPGLGRQRVYEIDANDLAINLNKS